MALEEKGNKLGGREVEFFKVDDESEPSKGVENANKLVQRDKVGRLDWHGSLRCANGHPQSRP